jgi:glycolate oxidase FAD binding subunit
MSETFEVIQKLKNYEINYFLDWGGSLIWLQIDEINTKMLKEIKNIIQTALGYLTVIKIEEDMKATIDVFTVSPIKYKISEKIKKSFDPKRILNPGKMYSGI